MFRNGFAISALSALGFTAAAVSLAMKSDVTAEAGCWKCERGSQLGEAPACLEHWDQEFGATHCHYSIESHGNPPMIYCTAEGFRSCSG